MGSAEPRSFSRGRRGIAGSLVFTVFDRDALITGLEEHVKQQQTFHRVGDHLNMEALTIDDWDKRMNNMALDGVTGSTGKSADQITRNISKATTPEYDDEVPPFDITISFANEYGQKATLVIYGVEILDEGTGFSIDNVSSEKSCTFVARRIEYMRPVDAANNVASGFARNQ